MRERLHAGAEPEVRATSRFGASVIGASALAATFIPGPGPGVNVLLLGVAAGAAVYAARPQQISVTSWIYAGLGLLLAAMTAIRAAQWVFAMNFLGALVLAGLAGTGARTWADIAWTPLALLGRVPRAPRFVASAVSVRRAGPVLRGVAVATVLLLVFGLLLSSADRAFSHLIGLLVPDWDLGSIPVRIVVFVFAALSVGTLGLARATAPLRAPDGLPLFSPRAGEVRLGRTEWSIPLGALDALFATFVGVQIAVLFGGHDRVLETAGLTYAEYAREGFFQLLAVSVLVLGVLAGLARFADVNGPRDVRRMRLLAGTLCALTFVVLLSAMHRLGLYEETFGYTRDRVLVHATLWWLAGILVLLVAAGALWRGGWLPRAVVVWSGAALLIFSAINPDGLVAERNVGRHARTGKIGLGYLRSSMSADAVEALLRLPEPVRTCVLQPLTERLAEEELWFAFNLGRARARTLLDETKLEYAGPCPPAGESR